VLPKSVDINGIWNVLPPGIHNATLEEIEQRFATNEKRRMLFEGFRRSVAALHRAGCKAIFLDGSFVTDKPEPGDFDVCWDPVGVDPSNWTPYFLILATGGSGRRRSSGRIFPLGREGRWTSAFLDFFQRDKDSGRAKGIIKVQLQ